MLLEDYNDLPFFAMTAGSKRVPDPIHWVDSVHDDEVVAGWLAGYPG